MIVLDEQLKNSDMVSRLANWYRGQIVMITSLRPGTVIKDDAIPMLLRRVRNPVFVTINTTDFWRRIAADRHYCVTCIPVSDDRVDAIADLMRRLFRFREFATNYARHGKVALVGYNQVRYYQVGDRRVHTLSWPLGLPKSGQTD